MSHRPVPFLRTRKTLFLSFFPRMERTKDPRGPAPRSASTPVACPRTPLRGTPPWGRSSYPARAVQSIAPASPPLPLAGQSKKTVRLDGKTRLVQAAVEAGADTTGGWYPPLPPTRQPLRRGRCPHRPAVNCPAKQHGTGQAAPVGAAGPILRHARAQWPGRRSRATQILPAGRDFSPKGPQKTAFWFLCRRGQRNPPPERRNSPKTNKVGATGKAAPLFCVQNGRRGETKFRRKFFCLLFFSRKVGRPLFPQ